MADMIQIRDLLVLANHGVTDEERQARQQFVIELDLTVDAARASLSDNIEDAVDYAFICDLVSDTVRATSFKLMERLCSEILTRLFEDKRILEARVRIGKPKLLAGATAYVSLTRKNSP